MPESVATNSPGASREWLDRIAAVNRRMLATPELSGIFGKRGAYRLRVKNTLKRALKRPLQEYWVTAVNALGALRIDERGGTKAERSAITAFVERQVDQEGAWRRPLMNLDDTMKGYPVLWAADALEDPRLHRAADALARYLLDEHPRAADGCLLYNRGVAPLLVDSLGMICPFLARYGRLRASTAARDLAVHQIRRFIEVNLDPDTSLPYHGYYAKGPHRLGMHGWGRGCGWFLLGLADTLDELGGADREFVASVCQRVLQALAAFQKSSGHWGWAVVLDNAHDDSSATAFITYSALRFQRVFGGDVFDGMITNGLRALQAATRPDGVVDGSMSDCLGLGLYPTHFGPQPWLQGMTTAAAAEHFARGRT